MTLEADTVAPTVAEVSRPPSARERFERIYRILRDRICLLDYPPGSMLSEEELAQDHMAHGHGKRRVSALLGVKPEVGEFGDFGIVRCDRDDLGAVVTGFDKEMRIGRTRLWHV